MFLDSVYFWLWLLVIGLVFFALGVVAGVGDEDGVVVLAVVVGDGVGVSGFGWCCWCW